MRLPIATAAVAPLAATTGSLVVVGVAAVIGAVTACRAGVVAHAGGEAQHHAAMPDGGDEAAREDRTRDPGFGEIDT